MDREKGGRKGEKNRGQTDRQTKQIRDGAQTVRRRGKRGRRRRIRADIQEVEERGRGEEEEEGKSIGEREERGANGGRINKEWGEEANK